ncbi:MAG: alcohol dehydrogenase [Nitrospiraceae bacterium]|nr:MAG: alcohol dehydrogenase [Nitrospiraceae bacterium]
MKIRAAVLSEMGRPRPYARTKPLVIEEVELAPPGPGEVLIRITAAGLCHSDLSVVDGTRPRPLPMVLGHEAAAVVEEIGEGVDDLNPGDAVVVVFVPSCGHCLPCAEGRPALCEPAAKANATGTLLSGARRLSKDGRPLNHHLGCSVFAERAVVSRRSLVPIDPALSPAQAALFGCAVLTGVGAVLNTAGIRPGSTVAIVGLGGVGLNALLGARLAGARRIIAIDTREAKLALARQLGATDSFSALDPDCAAKVREVTDGGVEAAIEAAGVVPALELAFAITRRGGTTVTAGLAHPEQKLALPQVQIVAEERTLKGSYMGSCVPLRDIPRYVALFRAGRLPVDALLSEHVPLDAINEALDRLADGRTVRQIILPHGS